MDELSPQPSPQTRHRINNRILVAAFGLIVLLMGWLALRPAEPSWKGHRLAEWLEAYDSHNRFDEGDGRRSSLSDEEIERALREMRPAALPVLVRWLTEKPGCLKPQLNRLLNQQSWIRLRFEDRDYQILAVTGFMAYGAEAQPVLPQLLKLSESPDADTRTLAYEAAFFTRPDKPVFLPLATRALQETSPGVREMAAQWLGKRFPEEVSCEGERRQR